MVPPSALISRPSFRTSPRFHGDLVVMISPAGLADFAGTCFFSSCLFLRGTFCTSTAGGNSKTHLSICLEPAPIPAIEGEQKRDQILANTNVFAQKPVYP